MTAEQGKCPPQFVFEMMVAQATRMFFQPLFGYLLHSCHTVKNNSDKTMFQTPVCGLIVSPKGIYSRIHNQETYP